MGRVSTHEFAGDTNIPSVTIFKYYRKYPSHFVAGESETMNIKWSVPSQMGKWLEVLLPLNSFPITQISLSIHHRNTISRTKWVFEKCKIKYWLYACLLSSDIVKMPQYFIHHRFHVQSSFNLLWFMTFGFSDIEFTFKAVSLF